MKVFIVTDSTGNPLNQCFHTYDEAKKLVEFYNTIHASSYDIEELELVEKHLPPKEYYVNISGRIPYPSILYGDDAVEDCFKTKYSISFNTYVDGDKSKYDKDSVSASAHTSFISFYFFFKLPYIENESYDDLRNRAEQGFFYRLNKFKERKEYSSIIEIAKIYQKMKEKMDEVQETLDN